MAFGRLRAPGPAGCAVQCAALQLTARSVRRNKEIIPAAVEKTGGGQVGWVGAGWPLAKLRATAEELSLQVRAIGSYEFAPDQVVAIVPHGFIPFIYPGVRIQHTRECYPERLIFWCLTSPTRLVEAIRGAGFVPTAPAEALCERRGMPYRWSAVLAAIFVWNGLFLLDAAGLQHPSSRPGPFSVLALVLVLVVSLTARRSPRLQALLLRPGRHFGEIAPLLNLLRLVCGLMLAMLALFSLLPRSPPN